mgnify:CR=1 FL=1
MMHKVIDVLLVEDDPGDVELTRTALRDAKVELALHVVSDGEAAMAYLRKTPPYTEVETPDLVILDLNLPRKDGREVLNDIKRDPRLKDIPVVILTTSDADTDVARAYAAGANCYVTKPVGLAEFTHVVSSIEQFWFTVVKLPPK